MKKVTFLFFLLAGILSQVTAQNFKANDPIPVNTKFVKGVLPNGMTYYIYSTPVNKNTASYYIIQNVGSILENDQQKGLAHFLEHMAFNGTKNFEGKGILNTLQKQGAVFGRNINAYTGYDETVYNLDNIPSQDESVVDNCLLILHDWSSFLSLNDSEIDAERGVITEEWRTRQNASLRILNQLSPYEYNNALYADRMPIGDMNIIKNFPYKALRDYYKDWYRPDLQAIAIVGDVDTKDIEARIKRIFADIPKPVNPKKRIEVAIQDNDTPTFKLALDKEISSSRISYMIRHSAEKSTNTYGQLEEKTQRSIAFSIVNQRLMEMTQKEDCPFKSAAVMYRNFTRLNDALYIVVSPKPNQQKAAFTAVMNEWIRACKFGFSKGEIEREVTSNISDYEDYLQKVNEISHKAVINMVKDDYLTHETISDPAGEFSMVKEILKNLDSEKLQNQLKGLYTAKNRVVTVTGVENENNLTQEQTFDIIKKAENNTELKPYVDTFVSKSLMDGVELNPGTIEKEEKAAEIGATTYTMSNGVKVHYKYANKNVSDVQLKGESYGGSSLNSPKDIPSVNFATSLATMSGVGSYSNVDLDKILTGKKANAAMQIGSFTESVNGSATTKDLESMMQLVYLRFTKPRFDANMFTLLKQRLQNGLTNKDKDIRSRMNDSLTCTLYGKDNPKIRLMNQQYIDDISFDKMKTIYQDRFADISNFEFFIVGDVTPEVLKPLLEKYIASIGGINRTETFKDNTVDWVSKNIDKDVFIKMEIPKSTVRIQYQNDLKYTQKNRILSSFLNDILTLRYTESIREKEGGTYGVQVSGGVTKLPKSKESLSITFDCDANRVEKLLPIVTQEIEKIEKGEISKDDIEKTKTNYLKSKEDSKNFNSYSMDLTYNYFRNNYNMDDPKNYTDIVKNVSAKDIQKFTKAFMKNAMHYEIVFKPQM